MWQALTKSWFWGWMLCPRTPKTPPWPARTHARTHGSAATQASLNTHSYPIARCKPPRRLPRPPVVFVLRMDGLPPLLARARVQSRRLDEEGKVVLDLGDTVKRMKENFGVEQVLAWHAMTGYWAGVEPEAPEMAVFGPHLTELSAPKGIREVDPEVDA